MALNDFKSISQSPSEENTGLVWAGEIQEGTYLAELQTGIIPQLIHLIIFDMKDDYSPVYESLSAFSVGDSLEAPENMAKLMAAIGEGLATLDA